MLVLLELRLSLLRQALLERLKQLLEHLRRRKAAISSSSSRQHPAQSVQEGAGRCRKAALSSRTRLVAAHAKDVGRHTACVCPSYHAGTIVQQAGILLQQ